ncbi:ABC transporter ATP-binding protein [Natronoglycomyces albus]|uniref:ABC transporter ATP-binding protein n=1 Tax=Natronoglycomyces albus TaxID=2811108 RepID=A0A895XRV9_9ACTN|nr:ABC transporter ATP-binding protein [Natronoglycomyces albus]QSB04358.1 ABC transporter ATP-binding protein [Natronoglycomyces albus]
MIKVENVSKTYKGASRKAVDSINLSVGEGELVALVGHNGAGKSTLFDILAGLISADSGTVTRDVLTHELGWCPQRTVVDWSLTVRQNISMALELRSKRLRVERDTVASITELMGLERYIDREVELLSGGELQRTQIARAIAGDPQLLILDEPTTGLDPDAIKRVMEYLSRRTAAGATAIVSTHETSRFLGYCTRAIAMNEGRIIADADIDTFMNVVPASDDLWDAYKVHVDLSTGGGTA